MQNSSNHYLIIILTILFNLSGHGHFDMGAYQDYFDGKLQDHHFTDAELHVGLDKLDTSTID